MVAFEPSTVSDNSQFCDKSVNFLCKSGADVGHLVESFSSEGMTPNILDLSNIREVSNKKTLLLMCTSLVPHLDKSEYEKKLTPYYYIYTYSSGVKKSLGKATDGHLTLPIETSDVKNLVKICHSKSSFETEIKDLQRKVESLESISELGQYTGSLIHDLNNFNNISENSLKAVKALRLKEQPSLEKIDFFIDKALKGSRMISSLSSRYQKFLHPRSEQAETLCSLNSIVEESISFVEDDLFKSRVSYKIEIDKKIFIMCNQVSLIQVLLNLFKNAIHAVKELEERWISVKISKSRDTIGILILDSGGGVPLHLQEKIFESFFSTKSKDEGSGFGLSFSRLELEKMGMKLQYIQARKTVFKIEIPHSRVRPAPE